MNASVMDVSVKVLIRDGHRILLVLEKEDPAKNVLGRTFHKPSMWGFPGGRPEPQDADEIDTAMREVKEETGLIVEIESDLCVRVEEPAPHHTNLLLLGYAVGGKLKGETLETIACRWFPAKILHDESLRAELCFEGVYPAHLRRGRELLSLLKQFGAHNQKRRWVAIKEEG